MSNETPEGDIVHGDKVVESPAQPVETPDNGDGGNEGGDGGNDE